MGKAFWSFRKKDYNVAKNRITCVQKTTKNPRIREAEERLHLYFLQPVLLRQVACTLALRSLCVLLSELEKYKKNTVLYGRNLVNISMSVI